MSTQPKFFPQSLNISTLPNLNIGVKMGWTDYVDIIKSEDMTDSLMTGIDCYGRPFVAFKISVTDTETGKQWQEAATFFQRYSDDSNTWAFGTAYQGQALYDKSRFEESEYEALQKRLEILIGGGVVRNMYSAYDDIDRIKGTGTLEVKLA